MNKIEIIITDDANGIKQASVLELKNSAVTLDRTLETIEDCLRGIGFNFKGNLTISEE